MLRVSEVADVVIQKLSDDGAAVPCDAAGCPHKCAYRVLDNRDARLGTWTRLLCLEHTKSEYGPAYNGTIKG